MNILFLHSSSGMYGASKILVQTIKALGDDLKKAVVCLPEDGMLKEKLEEVGAEVIIMPLGILRRKYFNPIGMINRAYNLSKASSRIKQIIRQHNIDIVYSNTTAVLAGAWATRGGMAKHVLHIHEIIEKPKFFANFIAKIIKNRSDKSIVVSNAVKKHWDGVYGGDDGKIVVIHNGIEGEQFSNGDRGKIRKEIGLDDDTLLVGMIGRVHYWKGQSYFLDMAAEMKTLHPKIKYLMVGDAFPGYEYLYDEINEKIEKLGLIDNVIQMRFRKDIHDIMSALDIFVLPSILPDPFPTVILESMHASKPIIATAQGGALEMIKHGVTGYHVPIGDAQKAKEIFAPLFDNEQQRQSFGEAGKRRVTEEFSLEKYTERMSGHLKSVLEQS